MYMLSAGKDSAVCMRKMNTTTWIVKVQEILYIFSQFSIFSNFHQLLTQNVIKTLLELRPPFVSDNGKLAFALFVLGRNALIEV